MFKFLNQVLLLIYNGCLNNENSIKIQSDCLLHYFLIKHLKGNSKSVINYFTSRVVQIAKSKPLKAEVAKWWIAHQR